MPAVRHHRHDVVVVGARAAGAATARLLGRFGHDVVLVDRAVFPADTLSTHQIARPGVVQLNRWGLLQAVLDSGAPPVRQVSFTAMGETVTRRVKNTSGVDLLVAPRRHILDTILAEAAAHEGVHMRPGLNVTGVHFNDSGRAVGVYGRDRGGGRVDIYARHVVGADGLGSKVARAVGARFVENHRDLGATQYAYFTGIAWPGIELFVAAGALAGVFPTHNGEACIWVCTPSIAARQARRSSSSGAEAFTAQLARAAPDLAVRLRSARRTSPVVRVLRAPNYVRRAHGPGWALVGDAGYHRDPITGHGISDAYRDAELLAVALDDVLHGHTDETTGLAEYQRLRDEAIREVLDLTVALAGYPPVPRFVQLQKQLSEALDTEAAQLAARPVPAARARNNLAAPHLGAPHRPARPAQYQHTGGKP
jgi:2-polyprenyl-6-methoxyphenol hydroxylase-like FAD-dependent oxidoreductase